MTRKIFLDDEEREQKPRGRVLVNLILDRSGSMNVIKDATIQGVNEYINGLKQDKAVDYFFSLTLFDVNEEGKLALDIRYTKAPISEVEPLTDVTYVPRGGTPLYDAIGKTVSEFKEKVEGKVLTVIMTDGEENASREFTSESIRSLIADKEAEGNWTFVYLGANQNAWAAGQKFGIAAGNTVSYTSTNMGMQASMNMMAAATASYSGDSSRKRSFTYFADYAGDAVDDKGTVVTGGLRGSRNVPRQKLSYASNKADS